MDAELHRSIRIGRPRSKDETLPTFAAAPSKPKSQTAPKSSTPSDYEELIRLIHERHDDMSKSYQRIAVYLTQNPNDVAVLSVSAIAERCGVHASNVVRFAQALGYDGFKTLQGLFQKRLSTAAPGFEARVKALERDLDARKDRSEGGFLRDLIVRDIASLQDLLADVSADCLHPSGRWQRAPGDDRVDAALLLPALRGAIPPEDPRARATLAAARTELGSDGYMYRYRPDDRPLGEAEGAFLLCGFTMALALHQHGHEVEAVRWFERNRAACGPPGLLTEEYDILQRQVRGNAPQAFVHALLLESAQRLASPSPAQAGPHPTERKVRNE